MEIKLLFVGMFAVFLWLLLYLSCKHGQNMAKLERLKEEIKQRAEEQAYAQSKVDMVRNLSSDDVNDRLRKIASKKR